MIKIDKSEAIPFNFFPVPVIKSLSRKFYGLGLKISKVFPYLKLELSQAEIAFDEKEYSAIILTMGTIYAALGFIIGVLLSVRLFPDIILLVGLAGGIVLLIAVATLALNKARSKQNEVESKSPTPPNPII